MGKINKLDVLLDKSFILMLLPLYFLQLIVFQTKFILLRSRVKVNGWLSVLLSVSGTAALVSIFVTRLQHADIYVQLNKSLAFVSLFDFAFYTSGFIFFFFLNVRQRNINVGFVEKLHDIHTMFKDDNFAKYTVFNWASSIVLLMFYFGFSFFTYHFLSLSVLEMFCVSALIHFDANYLYAIRLLKFLCEKTRVLSVEVQYWSRLPRLKNDEEFIEMKWRSILQYYTRVLEAFNIYERIFTLPIIYHITETFIHALIYIQVLIETTKQSTNSFSLRLVYAFMAIIIWINKNFVMHGVHSFVGEQFYAQIQYIENTFLLRSKSRDCSAGEKRTYKNMLRSRRVRLRRARRAGALPRLLQALATYTVVLLQFAFL